MRVFWGHSDPNLKVVDDGAFAKWLQSQDQYTSCSAAMASLAARAGHDQIAVVGYGFNPLPGTLADQVGALSIFMSPLRSVQSPLQLHF